MTIVSAFTQKDWEMVGFTDGNKESTNELSDEDIHCALLVIDAKNKLKKLKLPSALTCRGLIPLHGSIVLQQLVFPRKLLYGNAQANTSANEIIPILESILSKGNNSFMHFGLLKRHLGAEDKKKISHFMEKHKGKLGRCRRCAIVFCNGSRSQGRSCEKCGKKFCRKCAENSRCDGVEYACDLCERHLCQACSGSLRDIGRAGMACRDCIDLFLYDRMFHFLVL
jgi:hypothetical protein